MAQKKAGRGRPRKSPRTAASGFPATKRRKNSLKNPTSSTEPTSAFEALCQVTSAEYERLSSNNTNCDNRSDASSKSTEENRQVLSTPSDVQLPAWYGANIAPMKPYKSELILPPKKKKYLHYLAEAEDDNQIINNPFPQTETSRSSREELFFATEVSSNLPPVSASASAVVPQDLLQPGTSRSADQLAPLKFNPTPVAPPATRSQDTKTFSDVLDEHISRLIIQNDVIVSKQPAVVMSKRGRSREKLLCGEMSASAFVTESARMPGSHNESMVKTLLSSKITRKTMLKENAFGRQQVRPSGSSFSYLNPENSAIKDLLIKTYEEKGLVSSVLAESVAESSRQFKTPSTATVSKTGAASGAGGAGGILYKISSDQRSGSLIVPDLRETTGGCGNGGSAGWTVAPGNEWVVSIDERGRRRVRPEVTVFPETASYQAVAPSPGRSLRSPSIDSMLSSESSPSSVSFPDNRRVQSTGTFQPYRSRLEQETKMLPPNSLLLPNPSSVVRTAGIFHPGSQVADGRLFAQSDFSVESVPESHEKTLNALRGHLTGRRPAEEAGTSKCDDVSVVMQIERSSLPPKKRKSFHVAEQEVAIALPVVEEALALEPISPALPLEESRFRRQTVIQEPAFSGYATYVNENHASHLGFYSDLSRQYSTNVAFAQTLLQQGHYYPSFRYSCVTSNSIRGSRPIHVQNGESVSMYSNWSAMPSAINPTIRVDSSIYGKKKLDGNFVSFASKKSLSVCATSVETYTRKRQLILNGMNSFLPIEALRLAQSEAPPVGRGNFSNEAPSTSSERFFAPLTPAVRLSEAMKVEDVSEDEEEDQDVNCFDCGRKFPKSKMQSENSEQKFTCAHCLMTGRSRAETFPKQARPTHQPRRYSEASSRHEVKSYEPEKRQATEKPLMAQLKQKIIGHQQVGPCLSNNNNNNINNNNNLLRQEIPVQRQILKTESEDSKSPNQSVNQDAMDLSVRKSVQVPDWRTMEGVSNRFPCRHCSKVFNKEGQLYLHSRVHEMETTGRAERKAKQVRNERSASPNSLSATNENPRPFFCAECNVGFRIHGHLQKHLRSKGHITQLECLNRLPCGFYAELERQNLVAKLHTIIDTADCAKAFSCLTQLAKTVNVGTPSDGVDQLSPVAPS